MWQGSHAVLAALRDLSAHSHVPETECVIFSWQSNQSPRRKFVLNTACCQRWVDVYVDINDFLQAPAWLVLTQRAVPSESPQGLLEHSWRSQRLSGDIAT